jgi:hypothetical protein
MKTPDQTILAQFLTTLPPETQKEIQDLTEQIIKEMDDIDGRTGDLILKFGLKYGKRIPRSIRFNMLQATIDTIIQKQHRLTIKEDIAFLLTLFPYINSEVGG